MCNNIELYVGEYTVTIKSALCIVQIIVVSYSCHQTDSLNWDTHSSQCRHGAK